MDYYLLKIEMDGNEPVRIITIHFLSFNEYSEYNN
jgi:hypothetical protein